MQQAGVLFALLFLAPALAVRAGPQRDSSANLTEELDVLLAGAAECSTNGQCQTLGKTTYWGKVKNKCCADKQCHRNCDDDGGLLSDVPASDEVESLRKEVADLKQQLQQALADKPASSDCEAEVKAAVKTAAANAQAAAENAATDKAVIEELLKLKDKEWVMRYRALQKLATFGDAHAVAIIPVLAQVLEEDKHPTVLKEAKALLIKFSESTAPDVADAAKMAFQNAAA